MDESPSLLIVWHSRTGASQAMAGAAAAGAGSRARSLFCDNVVPEDMISARAYLFVCPENLATMSGAMKEFFDRTYYAVLGQIEGRAYATAVAAGSDGTGATRQIDRIVTGWRLRRVCEPLIVNCEAQTPEAILARKCLDPAILKSCSDLGRALVEGVELGLF